MRTAVILLGYAVVVAWLTPAPLARLTSAGVSARLGLAAWLVAMTSALTSAVLAVTLLVRTAVAGWPSFARTFCQSVSGDACPPQVYRSALFELSLAATAVISVLAAVTVAWKYGASLRRTGRRTRAHAEAARITGRRFPVQGSATAVVLDAPEPAVYCVPGRPATIVLTSGALGVLAPDQLDAVLAHEHAHLSGRHHLLLKVSKGLLAPFPFVPLFTRGAAEVARLAEMCADDVAARRGGRKTLLTALVAMGTGRASALSAPSALSAAPSAAPAASLAATGGAVTARVHRLLDPPARTRRLCHAIALVAVIVALAASSGALPALA